MKYFSVVALTIFLVSCGDPSLKINNDKSGEYPTLDRTDTLAGIDKNKNQVRDDIELYISKQGYGAKQKKAAMQFAKAYQAIVTANLSDKTAFEKVKLQRERASSCLLSMEMLDIEDSQYLVSEDLVAITANTKKRLIALLNFDQKLDGMSWELKDDGVCDE